MEDAEIAAYAQNLGLADTISSLRTPKRDFTELLSKLSNENLADQLKTASIGVKAAYFQVVSVVSRHRVSRGEGNVRRVMCAQ